MKSVWKEVSEYLDDHRQDWSPETQAMIKDLDTILDQLKQPADPKNKMWYVSRQGGFTGELEHAAHDSQKMPIPAPGYVAGMFRRLERQRDSEINLQEKLKTQGLDELLDQMEAYADTVEKKFGDQAGLAEFDHDCAIMRAEMLGMAKVLAIMNFGAEYRTDPEAAINRVRQLAAAQFED